MDPTEPLNAAPALTRLRIMLFGTAHPRLTFGLLMGVLALGALLRLWGISWGVPSPEIPHRPHHYDEFVSVRTLQQINRHGGDLNPEEAHLCGTFIFFMWHATAEVLNAVGVLDHLPHYLDGFGDPNYGRTILMGRAVITAIDLVTLFLLYAAGCLITGSRRAGLIAALFYAILPFQVIYSHYMRPHVAANFFVVALIIMSFLLLKKPHATRYFVITGALLGFAMASLYQLFALVMIPYLAYLYRRIILDAVPLTPKRLLAVGLHWRVLLLGAVTAFTFFLGCPFLFLSFHEVYPYIESQSSATDQTQFYLASLLDLSKPWSYATNALPTGLFTLVIPSYLSMFYMLFRKKYYGLSLPLLLFSALYFYYATKGYGLFAIRVLLYLFPIFALFTGIMLSELLKRWRARSGAYEALWVMIGCFFVPAFFYTAAYVKCMADRDQDPYRQVYEYFQAIPPERPIRAGFIGWEWDRYHVPNFNDLLNATHHDAETTGTYRDYQDPEHQVDYLFVFNFDSTMEERVENTLAELHRSEVYRFEKTFAHPFHLGPLQFDYRQAPTDFRYPFPIIHLFVKR